jgi:hypothetical protein
MVLVLLTSCLPDDKPWPLPPAPNATQMTLAMGSEYDSLIFVHLATGQTITWPAQAYDLAISASDEPNYAWLNGAQLTRGCLVSADFATTTTITGLQFTADKPSWAPESLLLLLASNSGQLLVLDRGPLYHKPETRYLKLRNITLSPQVLRFEWGYLSATEPQPMELTRLPGRTVFWQAESGTVDLVPAAMPSWDFVMARYTHIYDSLPSGDPFRYYSVTGALSNRAAGWECAQVDAPLSQTYTFDSLRANNLPDVVFRAAADEMGFDWKRFDFDRGFLIVPNRYYLLRHPTQGLFKLKYTSFLNDQGIKGNPEFYYQLLF